MEIRADLMDAHMYAFKRFEVLPFASGMLGSLIFISSAK